MSGQPSYDATSLKGCQWFHSTPSMWFPHDASILQLHLARRNLTTQTIDKLPDYDLKASACARVQCSLQARSGNASHLGCGAGSVGAKHGGIGQSLIDAVAGHLGRARGAQECRCEVGAGRRCQRIVSLQLIGVRVASLDDLNCTPAVTW